MDGVLADDAAPALAEEAHRPTLPNLNTAVAAATESAGVWSLESPSLEPFGQHDRTLNQQLLEDLLAEGDMEVSASPPQQPLPLQGPGKALRTHLERSQPG